LVGRVVGEGVWLVGRVVGEGRLLLLIGEKRKRRLL
jgi:hypothetical protein